MSDGAPSRLIPVAILIGVVAAGLEDTCLLSLRGFAWFGANCLLVWVPWFVNGFPSKSQSQLRERGSVGCMLGMVMFLADNVLGYHSIVNLPFKCGFIACAFFNASGLVKQDIQGHSRLLNGQLVHSTQMALHTVLMWFRACRVIFGE